MNNIFLETEDIENKWEVIKKFAFSHCNYVEFNIVYNSKELDSFLSNYRSSLIQRIKKKNKIYPSGEVVRFSLDVELISYIENARFSYFKDKFIEDPSFYQEDIEIIASITHEDQLYIDLNGLDKQFFIDKGFLLNCPI